MGDELETIRLHRYLQRIYYDPKHPGSFKGPNKLHRVVKKEGKFNVGIGKIRNWLNSQESYSLHKPVRRIFKRAKVIVTGLNDQYEADLADMQRLKRKNNGVSFLLVVIDVFSRYLWVETIPTKREVDVIAAFNRIFARATKPRRMRTDRGAEFTGRKVQDYFHAQNIEHWTAHNDEMKANFAERVIRTLKSSLWGYMRKTEKYRYVDVLQHVVESYNNTEHRSIGMTPSQVTKGHVERRLWWHLYKPTEDYLDIKGKPKNKIRYTRKVGDYVRISHKIKTFERGHDEKWTTEIFKIVGRLEHSGIPKYRLEDLQGENIKGTFYDGELQKVPYSEDNSFEVEEIVERRGRGDDREVFVKWTGWPDKFNSWIPEKEITST